MLFEVTREGNFEVIYIDAAYPELKEEINRIFKTLPKIAPATYNSRAINMQFRMPVKIPFEFRKLKLVLPTILRMRQMFPQRELKKPSIRTEEYDEIKSLEFEHPRASVRSIFLFHMNFTVGLMMR